MAIPDTRNYEQIRSMVEADLSRKIKELDGLQAKAEKIKDFMVLIRAALSDSGHHKLADYIESHIGKIE